MPMQPVPLEQRRVSALARWRGIALVVALIVAVAAPLWHLHVINRDMPSTHSDLVAVWVGARVALEGRNPYSDQTTGEIQRSCTMAGCSLLRIT